MDLCGGDRGKVDAKGEKPNKNLSLLHFTFPLSAEACYATILFLSSFHLPEGSRLSAIFLFFFFRGLPGRKEKNSSGPPVKKKSHFPLLSLSSLSPYFFRGRSDFSVEGADVPNTDDYYCPFFITHRGPLPNFRHTQVQHSEGKCQKTIFGANWSDSVVTSLPE